MSKWYWFFDCLKLAFMSILTKEDVSRHWVISEDRLEHYQQLERDYVKIKAERDMWYNIAQLKTQKFEDAVNWINANWRGTNEK